MEENNQTPFNIPTQITNPAQSPINQSPTPEPISTAPKPIKKYLIIGLLLLILAATGVYAYQFFLGNESSPTEENQQLNNSLSETETTSPEITEEMAELEAVVEELKDTYPEEAPPSLNIVIPENSGKIAR